MYFVPQRCCDIFSDLYDVDGNFIGHPDGGITGLADGRVLDFLEERIGERLVLGGRSDRRLGHLVRASGERESVRVFVLESFPPRYDLDVVSGLPNGACLLMDIACPAAG